MNLSCVICSDLLMPSDDIHMTTCGHAFHYTCLLQWLERSKTCPQCRNKCHEKSLIKAYFNVVANADLPEDNATLVHKLDNLTLSVREKDKKIKEFEDKDKLHKDERKKMKKTIKGLEELVQKKDFTIFAYTEELGMLRSDRSHMLKLQSELKELKAKMDLMSTIEHVITATAIEVEDMLARDSNPKTLAVLVASLKRELKASDAKKHEMRERMNSIQNDLHKERAKKKDLEDKLSTADSELYRLEQEIILLKKKNVLDTSEGDSVNGSVILNTPEQASKRKRPADDRNDSLSMSRKIDNILSSDSPYFSIKSSSIGLAPLLRPGLSARAADGEVKPTPIQNKLSEKFSIMRNPRMTLKPAPLNKNMVYNGLGGSEKKENFPEFPVPKETPGTSSDDKNSTKSRLKAGKLSKHPSMNRFVTGKVKDDYTFTGSS